MTNPTRTRAEIQAEIDKLQAELAKIPEIKPGDSIYIRATADRVISDQVRTSEFYHASLIDCIPAADLIPREEHERAVAEAKEVTAEHTFDAAIDIVCRGVHDYMLHNIDGHTYRVTVERVDAADAIANHPVHPGRPHDYDQGYPPDDKPADAEPVGPVAVITRRIGGAYIEANIYGRESEQYIEPGKLLFTHPFDPVAILECAEGMSAYRHGSEGFVAYRKRLCGLLGVPDSTELDDMNLTPMPRAVAPVGVKENLRVVIEILSKIEYKVPALFAVILDLRNIAAQITELPEPSEWAREHGANGYIQSRRRDLAAALLAKEGE